MTVTGRCRPGFHSACTQSTQRKRGMARDERSRGGLAPIPAGAPSLRPGVYETLLTLPAMNVIFMSL